ncbi:hypothetical protein N7541_009386 [Penicillium brevicompactum]|uniref:RRM domain-containing protein n=1 Tax=Penicillium brevicompactum TaxID=5074 RepID=A0A9W9QLK3_PENBR|nr:hypothetical protein N7541_009386 [Penicillium brevicompactum]
MRDHETGQSKEFGYVTYGSLDEAQRAVMGMNETELDGRRIDVNLAPTPAGDSGGGHFYGSYDSFGSASY